MTTRTVADDLATTVRNLRARVLVSCQAGETSPLNSPHHLAAIARSAALGGADGYRVDGPRNVEAIRATSSLPIIGINKQPLQGFDVYITPTVQSAEDVVAAGADIVAVDGTARTRPGGTKLSDIVEAMHAHGVPVMADIATVEDASFAVDCGVDLVATTMAGYTAETRHLANGHPALDLLEVLAAGPVPAIAEGRIWTPDDLNRCFDAGAHAVVIGSAITVPELITRRFVAAARTTAGEPSL